MKRLILIAFGIALAVNTPAGAQQANQNIPVLPVVPQQGTSDTEWFKLGDGFLQRQVEPTIAVSTRNPDHLLTFFNDYRAVDVPDDVGLGEETQMAALTLKTTEFMLAGIMPQHGVPVIQTPPRAAAEAWIGGSRSYDGGLTWSGLFMPGAQFDLSPASTAAPIFGLEAATDPVAVAGPCGYVYVAGIGFTRGDESKMFVARFQDLNNQEGGDTWEYQGMTILETGNNATNGYFLDKPHIALDVWRGPGAPDQCAHRVYVSYSTFNGLSKDGKIQSKVNFAMSEDYGASFDTQKINKNWKQNQGSFIAIDPRRGEPSNKFGPGSIYVFWRHFFDPDSIIMTRSTNYGGSWSNPISIIGSTPMATFDQPTISSDFGSPDVLSFRSNGFPTAVVTPEGNKGTLLVAWQERVNIDKGTSGLGQPDPTGSPRIVMMRSTNGGSSWTDVKGASGTRTAVDFSDRDTGAMPPAGFGALPDDRPSGPQVMPWLSYGGGRLALVYYESRGLLGGGDIGIQDLDLSPTTDFISGIDRVVDFRAALLDPATGQRRGTTQVSRYPIGATADLSDGEQVNDIAAVFPQGCDGVGESGYCQPSLNFMNKPQSGSGGSPFMGDYTGATPTVQFVYDEIEKEWRWALDPADVPYQAFHTVFADNRHLVPPTTPADLQEWQRYPFYGPPEIGGSCVNSGSRNTDVLTARVNAELIVSAPTTYKQLTANRGFPIRVQNGTGIDRFYRLEITEGGGFASFSTSDPSLDQGDVQVYPYSSVSQVVYVKSGAPGPIRVDVTEISAIGGHSIDGQTGSVTFNPDPMNPDVVGLGDTETQDPFVLNPFVLNPFVLNPFVLNESAANLSVSNPFVLNPFVLNPFVLNPGTENPFVLNPFVLNPFVLNSTYAVAPSDGQAKAAKSLYEAPDGTLRAPRPGESVMMTLRAFRLKPFCDEPDADLNDCIQPGTDLVFNPLADPPSAAVASTTCLQQATTQGEASTCFDYRAPDLVPVYDESLNTGLVVDAGDDLLFPVGGWTLRNQGTADATAENRDLRHGFYLTEDDTVIFDSNGDSTNADLLLTVKSTSRTLAAGAEEDFPTPSSVPIPANLTEGSYNLILYVDDLEEVSELDEINNKLIAVVPIYVEAPNVPPVANGADLETAEDTPLALTLSASDDDGDPLTYTVLSGPSNGSLSGTAPALTYSPNLDFNGPDSFTFKVNDGEEDSSTATVTITVTPVNDAPSFSKGADQGVDEDAGAQSIPGWATAISAGPADESAQTLTFNATNDNDALFSAQPAVAADGTLTFTPAADAFGVANITVTLSDNGGTASGGVDTSAAQLFVITVNAVNDPPVVDPVTLTINEDGSAVGTLTITDPDSSVFTYAVTSPPSNGTASFSDTIPGQFTYTPNENFNGGDQFTVTVTDTGGAGGSASVTITISAVNDPPVAVPDSLTVDQNGGPATVNVLANDLEVDFQPLVLLSVTQPANGAVADVGGGVVSYTPAVNYVGADSFTYIVGDGTGLTGSATVSVTVLDPVPDWGFVGLLKPWKPSYKVNAGSAIPLKWYYTEAPGSSVKVPSAEAMPEIRISGPFVCNQGEDSSTVEVVNDPGSSDLRYSGDEWQFNWDTVGLDTGCYNIRIYSQYTSQLDGPFRIQLR